MKYFILIASAVIYLTTGCKKADKPSTEPNSGTAITTGNTTNYNGYVVKTVGISRILLTVNDNMSLNTAELYGGGNKIILKGGIGNTVQMTKSSVSTCPDAVISTPDGTLAFVDQTIDNGKMLDTAGEATVIKLKGFDKSKTGYNQLNLVMSRWEWPAIYTGGFYNNVSYLQMKEAAGTKNASYGNFLGQLLSGNINVSSVQLAEPVSEKTYITEDHVVWSGSTIYDVKAGKVIKVDMPSGSFRFFNYYIPDAHPTSPVATGLKSEWVNADNGKVVARASDFYVTTFDNMKSGGVDQIVEPADTLTKVYLRVRGFDRNVYGFNQLRLFIVNDAIYKGELQVSYNANPTSAPTLNGIKAMYATPGLYCTLASPIWPHY